MNHTQHYINGHWITGKGPSFVSTNPADDSVIWQGRLATAEDTQAACSVAHQALTGWAATGFEQRAQHLQRFATTVTAKRQDLAQLISLETGKPHWEADTEVAAVINKISISIQAHQTRLCEAKTADSCLRYKPHGVVAVLGSFNFPVHLSNGHIVPALLAGNTVVYKPSELTPAVAAFVMQCWHDSGLPHGVLNCIQGDASSAQCLLDEDLQGVFFTGSYRTGRLIHQHFSQRPEVILALEMGGNNPLIIDTVSNIPAAVYNTLVSAFITAGQRCTCARRVFIPDNAYGDALLQTLMATTKTIQVGAPSSRPEPFMGPVIHKSHALAHLDAQRALQDRGGEPLLMMSLLKDNTGLLSPGIIDMTPVINPPDEEIFAPLMQVYRYSDFEEALTMANQTRYGLVAGLLSDNPARYQQFYNTIRAGLINWNKPTTGAASTLPFGGVGASGNHRPSAYFAADYCAYPIASLESPQLSLPDAVLPGIGSL